MKSNLFGSFVSGHYGAPEISSVQTTKFKIEAEVMSLYLEKIDKVNFLVIMTCTLMEIDLWTLRRRH